MLDSPADDAPRLVYADWLAERGTGEIAESLRWFSHVLSFNGYRSAFDPDFPPRPAAG